MIRPMTCLTMLLAAGSGLYLYQAKHQAYVLDRQIDAVTHETTKVHAHIAVLRAEYALMNDPSRLQSLAAAHLPTLAPLAPGQFTTLAMLDARLPPVGAPPAPAAPLDLPPAAIGVGTGHAPYDYPPAPESPAAPAVPAVVASLAAPIAARAVAPAGVVASSPPVAPMRRPRPAAYASLARPAPHRVAAYAPAPRLDPFAIQAAAPPVASQPSQVASALGMARGLVTPTVATYQRYQPGGAETLAR